MTTRRHDAVEVSLWVLLFGAWCLARAWVHWRIKGSSDELSVLRTAGPQCDCRLAFKSVTSDLQNGCVNRPSFRHCMLPMSDLDALVASMNEQSWNDSFVVTGVRGVKCCHSRRPCEQFSSAVLNKGVIGRIQWLHPVEWVQMERCDHQYCTR